MFIEDIEGILTALRVNHAVSLTGSQELVAFLYGILSGLIIVEHKDDLIELLDPREVVLDVLYG